MASTRERILDVANELFVDQGYDGTSLREIADGMGFSKAALYYHFRSKEEILWALLAPVVDLQAEMADRVEAARTMEEWGDVLGWVVDTLFANLGIFTLLTRNRTAVETLAEGSDFFGEHRRWHERMEQAVSRSGVSFEDRVRIVCALGAVGGFDDFGGGLLTDVEPEVLRKHIMTVVRQVLGLPKPRRVAQK